MAKRTIVVTTAASARPQRIHQAKRDQRGASAARMLVPLVIVVRPEPEAAADDRYVALDRALSKLEARLRRSRDRRKSRHAVPAAERGTALRPVPAGASRPLTAEPGSAPGTGGNERAGVSGPGPALEESPEPQPAALTDADEFIPIQMEGDGPVVVREKFHAAMPMSIDQALLEMELVGHDFYLFRDDTCGHPSVVYRRHGYQYGLIRLIENASADGGREHSRRA